MPELERRFCTGAVRAIRAGEGDDSLGRLIGHAAVFDKLSENLGGFREKVAPGAFANSIGGDVRALWNHDSGVPLGRTLAGTLALSEDDIGLAVDIDLPDTVAARDTLVSVERGDVTGMSFGFYTISDEWKMVDGQEIRTLLEVELFDVSPVTFPAYPDTDIAVRSLAAWQEQRIPAYRAPVETMRRRLALAAVEAR